MSSELPDLPIEEVLKLPEKKQREYEAMWTAKWNAFPQEKKDEFWRKVKVRLEEMKDES